MFNAHEIAYLSINEIAARSQPRVPKGGFKWSVWNKRLWAAINSAKLSLAVNYKGDFVLRERE